MVVVGGGIAGLSALQELARRAPRGTELVLLESSAVLGGCLRTAEVGGVGVDVGAEAMLARRPEGIELVGSTSLADDLVHPASTAARLWLGDRLVPMPRTLMGVPGDVRALDGVLSARGLARARLDAVLPATRIEGRDLSVGAVVEERFGPEVVDRLVEPLLGGVYAGHARELSLRAAVPQLVPLLEGSRSLAAAVARTLPPPGTGAPVFAGVRGGLGRVPEAIVADLGREVVVRTDATVRDLAHRPGGGWRLVVGSAHDPELLEADAVVLATPPRATARLLSDVAPQAALALGRVESASVAVVTFAVPGAQLAGVEGSGFLVPAGEGRAVKGATFSFNKWEWVRRAGGSGGRDLALLRCSLGRHREEVTLQRSDAELARLSLAELGEALGRRLRPLDSHVQRWGGALPQYEVGHRDRVDSVRRDVARHAGLAVCGAAYDGVGIPACVATARGAVTAVLDRLATMEP